jgi:hypothetical protein
MKGMAKQYEKSSPGHLPTRSVRVERYNKRSRNAKVAALSQLTGFAFTI